MTALLEPMMGWKFEELWKWKEGEGILFQKGLFFLNSLSVAGHQPP